MAQVRTVRGPAIFVAQYISDTPPFNTLNGIASWAASLGYRGIQLPIDTKFIDIDRAATDLGYCQSLNAVLLSHGIELTELSSHLQGQLVAVHPAYDSLFDSFAPLSVRGDTVARQRWATDTLIKAAYASRNLGLTAHATFSGSLAWPYIYPWPQRPQGLVEIAFSELGNRWRPILNAFEDAGVDCCFEVHPGEDVHDGVSFERFLHSVHEHRRCCILYDPSHLLLQQLDYLSFLDIYQDRIKIVHIKDAEFLPDGRSGVYGGFSGWTDRAGRFRAAGDGQIDFKAIFLRLAVQGFTGWAVLESECAFKDKNICAREGAGFIARQMLHLTKEPFDDFASSEVDADEMRRMMGLVSRTEKDGAD